MELLGIDVGFSLIQKSTGIACLHEEELTLYRADATWEDRKRKLPDFRPQVIAIDGPLLPAGQPIKTVRPCEQFFSRGLFCRRCKPGLSHFGTGFMLREAAHATRQQFGFTFGGSVVVEAFPNLFLGVLVSEEDYARIPKLRRGQKFDWLYDHAKENLMCLRKYLRLPKCVWRRVLTENDHELRAALICLLTAALEAENKAVRTGEETGGWFWLPPLELWKSWAIEAATEGL